MRPLFFDLADSSKGNVLEHTKQGALVHEVTHFLFVLATSDLTYNYNQALSLTTNPRTVETVNSYVTLGARNNADNWLRFYQGYAHRLK